MSSTVEATQHAAKSCSDILSYLILARSTNSSVQGDTHLPRQRFFSSRVKERERSDERERRGTRRTPSSFDESRSPSGHMETPSEINRALNFSPDKTTFSVATPTKAVTERTWIGALASIQNAGGSPRWMQCGHHESGSPTDNITAVSDPLRSGLRATQVPN